MARDGHDWSVVPSPDPGSSGNHLYGVAAAGDTVWAAGFFKTPTARSPLIELHLSS